MFLFFVVRVLPGLAETEQIGLREKATVAHSLCAADTPPKQRVLDATRVTCVHERENARIQGSVRCGACEITARDWFVQAGLHIGDQLLKDCFNLVAMV